MKKVVLTTLLLTTVLTITGQEYEPNTKWPYLYKDFTKGTIYFEGNQKASTLELNVHLWGNALHYVGTDGRIYQSSDQKVMRVEIGTDAYIFFDHKLVKIIAVKGTDLLVSQTQANFDALNTGSGAYGASLNSSASRDLSSLDLGGLDKPELGKMLQEKNDGRTIPLSTTYFFIIDGKIVDANKRAIGKMIQNDRKDQWESLLKNTKIRWKDSESLCKILDFLSTK